MFDKIKDKFKSKKKSVDLEWDAADNTGKGIAEQPLPEYSPEAFDVPTEKKEG